MIPILTRADIASHARKLFKRPLDADATADEAGLGHPASELDFTVRPISREWRLQDRHPAYRTAVANVAYILRDSDVQDGYGPVPKWFEQRREDLVACGLEMPKSAPAWAGTEYDVWRKMDAAADKTGDPTTVSAWHILAELPDDVDPRAWTWLVRGYVERNLVRRGAVVSWAIHALFDGEGGWAIRPHVHLVVSARRWRTEKRHGDRMPSWAGSWQVQHRLAIAWRKWLGLARVHDRRLSARAGWSVPLVMRQRDLS